ncbi:hypothetical protein [Micromonospora sp. DT231]|uniref:hypothetical protein n=1 Tax=Micromonospora sp. DT231 TaxID=3416526 RepID=UPI003CF55A80
MDTSLCPWLVLASDVTTVCAIATWLAGYTAALDGELNLLWADALTAAVYAVAAFVRHLGGRHGMPPESEAVGGL